MVVFLAVDPRIIISAIDKKLEDVPDEVNLLSALGARWVATKW